MDQFTNEKKKRSEPPQKSYCKPLIWLALILAFILIALIVFQYMMPAKGAMTGGRRRGGMRGGDCGCAASASH